MHSLWKNPAHAAVAAWTAPYGGTEPDLSKQRSIWDSSAKPGQAAQRQAPQQAADATWPTPAQAMQQAPSTRKADIAPPQPIIPMQAADGTIASSNHVSEQHINEPPNLWDRIVGADDQQTTPTEAAHALLPIVADAATAPPSEPELSDSPGHAAAASAPGSSADVSLPDSLGSPRGSGSSWTAVPTRSSHVQSIFKPPVHHWPGFQAPGNADYKPFNDRQSRPVRTVLTKPPGAEVSSHFRSACCPAMILVVLTYPVVAVLALEPLLVLGPAEGASWHRVPEGQARLDSGGLLHHCLWRKGESRQAGRAMGGDTQLLSCPTC